MRRSLEPRHRRRTLALVIGLLAGPLGLGSGGASRAASPTAPAPAPPPVRGPLVQVIDADDRGDHTDVSIEFACSIRYLSNLPLNHGRSTTITLRLGPDCGSLLNGVAPELPLVGGGGSLVAGARLDSVVPGEVTLELRWSRELDFVMAPTALGQGLRIRLLGTGPRKGGGYITLNEAPQGYAVNLDSSYEKFVPAAVEAAARALRAQAYVSETDIEDRHWYRLRVGPFASRQEAERVLQIAQQSYPRAWLAVDDEQTDLATVAHAGVSAPSGGGPADPPLPENQRAGLLLEARTALEQHRYPAAIDLLTRLLRQPEFPARADVQELMGLARERSGQLAHAKAEYEEYLRRYPDGPGAVRVRARLQALANAGLSPRATGDFGAGRDPDRWTMAGSAAITYEYGRDQVNAGGTASTTTAVNNALVYGDLLLRDRGERYGFTARIDGGYTANFAQNFGGSQDRTTLAYAELSDRITGLTGRVGRQSLASEGAIGLFDGLYVGYQASPKLTVGMAAGFPAYTSYSQFSTQDRFGILTAEYGPYRGAWVFDGYVLDEQNGGATERRSLGAEVRYSQPTRSAVLLTDYDFYFQQLNAVTLIGNLKLGRNWIIGFDADHRRSPLLLLGNALIGQSAPDLTTLATEFTPSQIRQLALDRTATSSTAVLSATRSLGQRWQLMANLSGLELSGTPASGGVAATSSTGLDKNGTLQMSGASLIQASDLHIFGVRYDDSPLSRSVTLTWDARFVLPGAWRVGPRFSVERLEDPSLGGRQMLYLPELRSDWTGRSSVFELIGGYQVQLETQQFVSAQSLTGAPQSGQQSARHLYLSATYRRRF